MAYGSPNTLKAHAALTALVRVIWNLTPIELFTQPSPNFRYLATQAVKEGLKLPSANDRLINDLSIVFKRIRKYYRFGRETTSFNSSDATQIDILGRQNWRCAHCRYPFEEDLDLYAAEHDGFAIEKGERLDEEIRLDITFRRPELDHIIPHLIGGDSPENWQILCRSCNAGKSDSISGLARQFSHMSVRIDDLYCFTPSKRYAVIAEHRSGISEEPLDCQYFRVFKRNSRGFLNIENLVCRPL